MGDSIRGLKIIGRLLCVAVVEINIIMLLHCYGKVTGKVLIRERHGC